MTNTFRLINFAFGNRIQRKTREHLAKIAQSQIRGARHRASTLLAKLSHEPGPHVLLGQTEWAEDVRIPLSVLVQAHSIITGGTGTGKSMSAIPIIEKIIDSPEKPFSFGIVDGKGELFERALYLIGSRLAELPPAQAQALLDRVVIIDFASADPVTSYNIANPWSGSDPDFFATSRVETLQELLPSGNGNGFSLRGLSMVKNLILLLAEHGLPFSYYDRVLSSDPFRAKLLAASQNPDVQYYFSHLFPSEGRATISAVQIRLASALFSSTSLKLALSGTDAPNFRDLQDQGKLVLINCAGPNIARRTAQTLQALIVSDIRQAVFARKTKTPLPLVFGRGPGSVLNSPFARQPQRVDLQVTKLRLLLLLFNPEHLLCHEGSGPAPKPED